MTLAFETRSRPRRVGLFVLLAALLGYSPSLMAQAEPEGPEGVSEPAQAVPESSEAPEPDVSEPATKEDPHIRAAARGLASRGAIAFEEGQFKLALDYFQRAGVLIQAPTILVMEARTLAQLGRLIEALDKYETAQRIQLPSNASDAFKQAVHAAGEEVRLLRSRIPQLNITIQGSPAGRPPEVWLDERKVLGVLIGVDQPVDPGQHLVEVRGAGFAPIFRQVDLSEGVSKKVVIELPLAQAPPPAAEDAPPRAVVSSFPQEASGLSQRTVGWVALGVGAGASIAGVVTGLIALNKKAELDDVCMPGCPASYADDISTFRTQRTLSYLSFGLGLVAAGSGGYLLLSDRTAEPQLALGLSPTAASLRGAF